MRVLFGESSIDVAEAMEIHSAATVNLWVNVYRKKIEEGLITLAPMTVSVWLLYSVILCDAKVQQLLINA